MLPQKFFLFFYSSSVAYVHAKHNGGSVGNSKKKIQKEKLWAPTYKKKLQFMAFRNNQKQTPPNRQNYAFTSGTSILLAYSIT